MTTYTAIPNSSVDTDSPVTQDLMTLLRDNPIAITEGATSAPRVNSIAWSMTEAHDNDVSGQVAANNEVAKVNIGFDRTQKIIIHANYTHNISAQSGDSTLTLQGSDDDITYTTIQTLVSVNATTGTLVGTFVYDVATTYQYYRLYANGDGDHDLSGSIALIAAGDT